ncbi:MAG: hypothetical protein ABIP01_06550 [Candidatus Limnocylindria bacterium]
MAPLRSRLATLTAIALGVTGIGAAVLLVAALVEMLTHPGMTLVDAYWVGRLPWTPIAIGLVLLGGTAAVVIGAITAWLLPARAARVISVPAILATAFWWAISVLQASIGACCGSASYNPFTVAYSSPQDCSFSSCCPRSSCRSSCGP